MKKEEDEIKMEDSEFMVDTIALEKHEVNQQKSEYNDSN